LLLLTSTLLTTLIHINTLQFFLLPQYLFLLFLLHILQFLIPLLHILQINHLSSQPIHPIRQLFSHFIPLQSKSNYLLFIFLSIPLPTQQLFSMSIWITYHLILQLFHHFLQFVLSLTILLCQRFLSHLSLMQCILLWICLLLQIIYLLLKCYYLLITILQLIINQIRIFLQWYYLLLFTCYLCLHLTQLTPHILQLCHIRYTLLLSIY
jgi:hypothetical protein